MKLGTRCKTRDASPGSTTALGSATSIPDSVVEVAKDQLTLASDAASNPRPYRRCQFARQLSFAIRVEGEQVPNCALLFSAQIFAHSHARPPGVGTREPSWPMPTRGPCISSIHRRSPVFSLFAGSPVVPWRVGDGPIAQLGGEAPKGWRFTPCRSSSFSSLRRRSLRRRSLRRRSCLRRSCLRRRRSLRCCRRRCSYPAPPRRSPRPATLHVDVGVKPVRSAPRSASSARSLPGRSR